MRLCGVFVCLKVNKIKFLLFETEILILKFNAYLLVVSKLFIYGLASKYF
jgi:hypothetical protein